MFPRCAEHLCTGTRRGKAFDPRLGTGSANAYLHGWPEGTPGDPFNTVPFIPRRSVVDLLEILRQFVTNPFVFFALVFLYAIAVAIFLPIPIEFALVFALAGGIALFSAALLAVALGKAVGAWLVFLLGVKVEGVIHRWSERAKLFAKILAGLEKFVRWTGAFGLYVLLSIPFMSDTAILYFYALFNEEGRAIDRRHFIVSNFLAGVNRVALFFLIVIALTGTLPRP